MARPTVIRDETIVEAARQVFLERGFRATTSEVAERAGVSEGSIFKRFKSKVELFQAAMGVQLDEPGFLATLNERVGRGEPSENLFDIGMEMVAFFRSATPLMMMAWSNSGEDGVPCGIREPNPLPLRVLKAVSSFFELEMRSGRLRRHDPEVAARAFLGAIHNFIVFEVLFRSQEPLPLPTETFMRGLVNLLRLGIEPEASQP